MRPPKPRQCVGESPLYSMAGPGRSKGGPGVRNAAAETKLTATPQRALDARLSCWPDRDAPPKTHAVVLLPPSGDARPAPPAPRARYKGKQTDDDDDAQRQPTP